MKKTLIIGGGAAGLACASALRGEATLLEAGEKAGRKLTISGGGHANFTNANLTPNRYLVEPAGDFCLPVLKLFGVREALRFVAPLPWEEREKGKFFLKCPARQFTELLTERAKRARTRFGRRALAVEKRDAFTVRGRNWEERADFLVLACGSPARPALGANASGWTLARRLGLKTLPPRPALTPLKIPENPYAALSGIGVFAQVRVEDAGESFSVEDDLLFTAEGLSGPAVLRASLRRRPGAKLRVNFLPGTNFETELDKSENAARTPLSLLKKRLPDRLAAALAPPALADRKIAELSRKNRRLLARTVNDFAPPDFEFFGFDKAEVAAGGVLTAELNPRTMEARAIPNLFIIGELCAVTGDLGGFNLHWAFGSALACAAAINARL